MDLTLPKVTEADFERFADVKLQQVKYLLQHKGQQYAPGAPAFNNLERGSAVLGVTIPAYVMALATKQWYVLCDWSKAGTLEEAKTREVHQRIQDVIVYMLLLLFYLHSIEEKEQSNVNPQK